MRYRLIASMALASLLTVGGAQRVRAQFASGLYVSNVTAANVSEVVLLGASNAPPVVIETSGLSSPSGIGFSPDGSLLYVANAATNSVNVYNSPNTAPIQTISLASTGTASSQPAGLTVDSAGNVYVAMHSQVSGDSVLEIQNAGTHPYVSVYLTQGIAQASGISATNSSLYVGTGGGQYGTIGTGGQIFHATNPSGASPWPTGSSTFGLGVSGLVSDGTYLYAAVTSTVAGRGFIEKILLSTGVATQISTTLTNGPYGLTLDSSGNLYFNIKNGNVDKLAGAAGLTSPTAPTVFNNKLVPDVTGGHGPTYLAYNLGPFGSGPTQAPEPGSLAMSGLVGFLGLAGYRWKRRRAANQPAATVLDAVALESDV